MTGTYASSLKLENKNFSHYATRHGIVREDVNGEKLTVKKWWIFGADFFTVWCRFFHGLRRFFTVCKGHKR